MFWGHPMAIVVYICLMVIVTFTAVTINWFEGKYKKSRRK